MHHLPTGTLAFLFTDVAESTRLWDREPAAMRTALARHDQLVETIVGQHDGVLVRPRGEGDSRFAVFRSSVAAVRAATELQRALQREAWPLTEPLSVRMAVHSGEADLRDGDYYGSAPNRCARLRALAYPGQILLSDTTARLVCDELPEHITLRDLGVHQLKDLTRPEQIFQVLHPELRAEFPPVRGGEAELALGNDATWPQFRESVHSALVRLYDPPALETHPLATVAHAAESGSGERTPGRALRKSLLAAIQAIGAEDHTGSATARAARLARLRYVDGEPIERIREELVIGRSEYFREHGRALDAIAAVLRTFWSSSSLARPPRLESGFLPRDLTSFVGRQKEQAEILELLRNSPLVTLIGPGGVGKTRLALAAARAMKEGTYGSEPRAVWFADLSGVPPDGAVDGAVAATLRLRETPGKSLSDALTAYLAGEPKVLVLDNCEHVAHACASLVTLLVERCAMLRILATSREPLRASGEVSYRILPLSYPDPGFDSDVQALECCEAVQLFVARAQTVLPGFRLVEQNVRTVAQICRRLEGVPLAVELAAARMRGLSVGQIAARLDDSLQLLTGGDRSGAGRHETLRTAVEWSHALLSESERRLFRGLSVFSGGWSLDAAEAVCRAGLSESVVEDLVSLVNKSMIVADPGDAGPERYHLLEILRQYARYQLEAAGERAEIERRHAMYFRELAEAASTLGTDEEDWLDRLDLDIDNVRAALRWSMQHDIEGGLAIAAALWRFWYIRGSLVEGRDWLAQLLQRADPVASPARAAALFAAAQLAIIQGASTHSSTRPFAEESLAIRSALGDTVGVGWSTHALAHCAADSSTECQLLRDSAAVLRETSDEFGLAWTLHCLANAVDLTGEEGDGRMLHEESLRLFKKSGNRSGIALGLIGNGHVAARRREFVEARDLYEQGLALQRELKTRYLSDTLNALGRVEAATGRLDQAVERFRESLEHCRTHGARWEGAFSLEGLADVALASGAAPLAVRLLAAAHGIRAGIAAELSPNEQRTSDGLATAAKAEVDSRIFETEWATGSALTWDEAISEALSLPLVTLIDWWRDS